MKLILLIIGLIWLDSTVSQYEAHLCSIATMAGNMKTMKEDAEKKLAAMSLIQLSLNATVDCSGLVISIGKPITNPVTLAEHKAVACQLQAILTQYQMLLTVMLQKLDAKLAAYQAQLDEAGTYCGVQPPVAGSSLCVRLFTGQMDTYPAKDICSSQDNLDFPGISAARVLSVGCPSYTVTFFELPNYQGRSFTVSSPEIPFNLVDQNGLNDKIRSVLLIACLAVATTPSPSSCPMEYDAWYVGHGYRSLLTESPGECCQECKADPKCKFWTWTNEKYYLTESRKRCYMKTATDRLEKGQRNMVSGTPATPTPSTPTPPTTPTAGCTFDYDANYPYPGYGQDPPATTAEQCCELCRKDSRCKFFSFAKANHPTNRNTCFLKAGKGRVDRGEGYYISGSSTKPTTTTPTGLATTTSAPIRSNAGCPMEYNASYVGNGYRSLVLPSAEECCQECTADPKCKCWVFANEKYHEIDFRSRCFIKQTFDRVEKGRENMVSGTPAGSVCVRLFKGHMDASESKDICTSQPNLDDFPGISAARVLPEYCPSYTVTFFELANYQGRSFTVSTTPEVPFAVVDKNGLNDKIRSIQMACLTAPTISSATNCVAVFGDVDHCADAARPTGDGVKMCGDYPRLPDGIYPIPKTIRVDCLPDCSVFLYNDFDFNGFGLELTGRKWECGRLYEDTRIRFQIKSMRIVSSGQEIQVSTDCAQVSPNLLKWYGDSKPIFHGYKGNIHRCGRVPDMGTFLMYSLEPCEGCRVIVYTQTNFQGTKLEIWAPMNLPAAFSKKVKSMVIEKKWTTRTPGCVQNRNIGSGYRLDHIDKCREKCIATPGCKSIDWDPEPPPANPIVFTCMLVNTRKGAAGVTFANPCDGWVYSEPIA